MPDRFIQGILNFMGDIAALFFPLQPDNYLFIELATFLLVLLLAIVALIFFVNRYNRRKGR